MPSHELPHATGTSESADTAGRDDAELEEVHELQDHEFTLELEDTIEIPSSLPPASVAAPEQPPLPRWAAASRALLDSLQQLLDVDSTSTIEVAPAAATPGAGSLATDEAESSARDKLARLALQMHAREVYCNEIERALVAAAGRVRGQAFRIAELEAELQAARATPAGAVLPTATPQPPTAAGLPHDDLKRIRGIGPRFAQRLAELGVTSFESIANWKASDVANIAEQLGIRRERITRDSWMKQARTLRTEASRAKRKPR